MEAKALGRNVIEDREIEWNDGDEDNDGGTTTRTSTTTRAANSRVEASTTRAASPTLWSIISEA